MSFETIEDVYRIQEMEEDIRRPDHIKKKKKLNHLFLEIKSRIGQSSVVNYDTLKHKLEEKPFTSPQKICEEPEFSYIEHNLLKIM